MSFLYCKPSVFVIGNEYEILLHAKQNGIFTVEINGNAYYEENSGVLYTEKSYAKIRVPQGELDLAKEYVVNFRRTIERKAYFSELGEVVSEVYKFKALEKVDNINIYHVADVHFAFDKANGLTKFFGDDLDLLVVNGDIGEVERIDDFRQVAKFVGDMSDGKIPVVFVRGNHDTRGKLAELYSDYFPVQGKKTYFDFEVGCLRGLALDCGEDKVDCGSEYGGVNIFELYRRKELDFLKKLKPSNKLTFAVSHICPAQTTQNAGDIFDIERDLYTEWNNEIARIGVKFMLCGHVHKAYLLEKNDGASLLKHEYPVVVGSQNDENGLLGTAITLSKDKAIVRFTDTECKVVEEFELNLLTGKKEII